MCYGYVGKNSQHAIGLLQLDPFAVVMYMLVALIYTHLDVGPAIWQHCVDT